jgi:A/G-specific adenine glycosylase
VESGCASYSVFVNKLLEWWSKNQKKYPWREEWARADPYRILIAETMLQRTRAEQVVSVYMDFLREFPTVQSLASAELERVEKYFRKLGITYRSARLLETARYIVEKAGGRIPRSREELLEIPGVGEYVADAIRVFAFGEHALAIDANVARVAVRYFGLEIRGEARRDPQVRKVLAAVLEAVPRGRAAEFNWALIDFAASVCTSRNPECGKCPLRESCAYFKNRA